jgi:hypothetical protein
MLIDLTLAITPKMITDAPGNEKQAFVIENVCCATSNKMAHPEQQESNGNNIRAIRNNPSSRSNNSTFYTMLSLKEIHFSTNSFVFSKS